MQTFISENITANASAQRKLVQLINAVMSQGALNLNYEDNKTFTASETFAQRAGNCLSFTNMFIALAREAGISAYFQEVDIPPTWSKESGLITLSRHLNVLIKTERSEEQVIDFNQPNFQGRFNQRKVTDDYAFAQYYSNIGVDHLHLGQHLKAFSHFKKAIQLDPTMPHSWTNLGALYSTKGLYSHAEAAYLQTLRYAPKDEAALNNLNRLYDYLEKQEHAKYYRAQIVRFRENNPYYFHFLAQKSLEQDDLESAKRSINKAIRIKKDDPAFYYTKSVILEKSANRTDAARNLKLAIRHALPELKKRYQTKLLQLESTP